jgi:uncharacterized protein YndB with AHSA1/START domain
MDRVIAEEIDIAASPESLFDAWTKAEHMTAWWRNEGEFFTERFESDLRPGGKWLVRFKMPDGSATGAHGEYLRVEKPTHLAFSWKADWDAGCATKIELEFHAIPGGTRVKLVHSGFDEAGWRDANKEVWHETLDWLRCYLGGR